MSDNQNALAQKTALRAEMRQRLRALTPEDRQSLSDEICERVLENNQWQEAQSVILFTPLPSEPIIMPLKLDCEARKVSWVAIAQSSRPEAELHLPDAIDLILVPGLAFSKDRHRLGRGGGFFDRLLAGRAGQAFKLGICFSFSTSRYDSDRASRHHDGRGGDGRVVAAAVLSGRTSRCLPPETHSTGSGQAPAATTRLIDSQFRFQLYAHMRSWKFIIPLALVCSIATAAETRLPFKTVFKGQDQFNQLVSRAKSENWKGLPIGERTAAAGQALVGTRYKHFTLEIDNRIEAPSVNFQGMDCWTFFEIALAFARMLDEPEDNWTPERLLHYIELDRYRGGECTGEYLSRLHYLEDWLFDNDRRGLIVDLTRELGGASVPHSAREMTVGWRHYRYLAHNRTLLGPLAQMEARVSSRPLYQIPKRRVTAVEPKLRNGDIIGIISRDRGGLYSTAHVGLALRTKDGVLHFMHASSPGNSGKVVVDARLSKYLYRYASDSGILIARPLR